MANPIVEEIEKIGQTFEEFKKVNDTRLAELEKGNAGRAKELDVQLDKMSRAMDKAQSVIKELLDEKEKQQSRIELLEAWADRPKGTPEERKEAAYADAFFKAMRGGFQDVAYNNELKGLALQMQKDVSIGTNAAGGFALPKLIGSEVEKLILKFSEILQNVKMIQVGTSDYQELVSYQGGSLSGWISETGSRTATNTPQLRSQKPTWGELYAYPASTEWALQDMQFDVASWLTENIAEQFSVDLATAVFNGNGSSKPTGMTNTAPVSTDDYASPMRSAVAFEYHAVGSEVAAQSSPVTSWKADCLIGLVYLLRPGYRPNAKFAMNTLTQAYVRKLKDTTNQYLWQPSLQVGQPDRLLGYPVFTWEDLGNPTTASALPVAFGDFRKAYLMTYRTELMMTVDNNITTPGQVKFFVRRRYGGFPLNNDSVKFLKVSAS